MPTIDSASGVEVVVDGRRLVSFAGCDYLGLARHPEVIAAAHDALDRCGVGAGASRTTTGTWTPHAELEKALAKWMRTDDAVLLPSGWVAGSALATALAPECDVVLVDGGAHPALRDAAKLTGLPVREFPHFDAAAAARLAKGTRPLVLTDAIDVALGALAPLRALGRLVERTCGELVVDDAHGVGVLGAAGTGAVSAADAAGWRVHVAGSLSKSLGAHGGFVADTRQLCETVRKRFAGYAGGTPIPPSTAAAALAAIRLASDDDELRRRLRSNCVRLAHRFASMRLPVPRRGTPWFAVARGTRSELRRTASRLAREGFLVPHVSYFGAPPQGYLKIAVTAAHETPHIDALAYALRDSFGRASKPPRVER